MAFDGPPKMDSANLEIIRIVSRVNEMMDSMNA